MATGLVLVVAVLMLGGVIATVGDRLGMRVGKARLTLFNLRPRQTATLVTILTGSVISASTLAVLFAISDQLRTGVFELGEIQDDLETAREELSDTATEKQQIERELTAARKQQAAAQDRLRRINESLQTAVAQQDQTQERLNRSQAQLQQVQTRFQQAQQLLSTVSQQTAGLRNEIEQLQADQQLLIQQRDQVREQIAQRDQEIAQRDQEIAEREAQLQELEGQRSFLVGEIQTLYQEYQGLRQGNVALLRNQPLASAVARITADGDAQQAVNQLLSEANRVALQRIRPDSNNPDEQVIQLTSAEVEQVIQQLQTGQEYVLRVLSGGNYVVGEPCVLAGESCIQVFLAAAPNTVVFQTGEVIASTSATAGEMTDRALIERVNLLIAAAQFRARQAGILGSIVQIADGRTESVLRFFEQLQATSAAVEIQAVAAEPAYTSGPLKLQLVAVQNGQVLFRTQ